VPFPGHFYLFPENCFAGKLLVKPFICWAHSGLKSRFFIWGFKINFQEKNNNIEWQRENMATSGTTNLLTQ
jgi:hypothetical protein